MPKQVLWPDAPPRRQEGGDATTSQEELAWMPKWGVGSYSPAAVAGRLSQAYTTAAESHLRIGAVDNVFKAKQWLGSLIGWESLSPTLTRLNKLLKEAESLHFWLLHPFPRSFSDLDKDGHSPRGSKELLERKQISSTC